ncbi:MAG: YdiU family protein [Pseudomonadota bacterium]
MNSLTPEDAFSALQNTYAELPERFYAKLAPTPVAAPKLIKLNVELADLLGFDADALASQDGVSVLAGNRLPDSLTPLAMAYAGHQFGGFVPQLGDGRAILLGDVVGRDGVRRDIQLKGSGPTPFSRMGDGRAAVGPVLREYIVSEAMAALGIPTTRALAAVATGESVFRETPLPGAVLTRVAQSHLRVGTFQYFAARQDLDGLRQLADYAIDRHDPDARSADNPYGAFLDGVVRRQADLIARWLNVGFIHGVMNTDNTSIAGETIDYGPCAFMDTYDPETVYSSIDVQGRYAYGNQPNIAQWNLACLAHALLPLLGETEAEGVDRAKTSIGGFPEVFEAAWQTGLRRKIGLSTERDGDRELTDGLLSAMVDGFADFTLAFRRLEVALNADEDGVVDFRSTFADQGSIDAWLPRWRARLALEASPLSGIRDMMRDANPLYIPRNHQVEAALAAAVDGDFNPFEELVDVLKNPYRAQRGRDAYTRPPQSHEVVQQTFCGT